jgi:predicted ATPase
MLRRLRLENFRAFDSVEVNLAPLTVLLGANSTGKSSILHALVLLKQSLLGGDYRIPLTFGGPLVDLGSLGDVAWQGNNDLCFELEWDEVDPWYFSFTNFFTRLRYVGPLRMPSAEMPYSGEEPESVGSDARYLIPFLISRPDVQGRIGEWLRQRGLAAGVEVRETAKGSGRWAAYILEKKKGRRVNLTNTGFGYSQLVPVLAEIYGAPRGSLILIEQPELHLNPRLAVWMGDVLLSAAKEGKAVLVETHSEHVVLRVRRRIAEGVLPADQLALYFASRSLEKSKSYLTHIALSESGQPLEEWPEGFWGEDYDEAFHLARATLGRDRE